MTKKILATKFDLPFALRLPSSGFLSWDPVYEACAILPSLRVGEVSFSKEPKVLSKHDSFDTLEQATTSTGLYTEPTDHIGTCISPELGEIQTLHVRSGIDGGFSELRGYSEITIFSIIDSPNPNIIEKNDTDRTFSNLNHFLDIYRVVTQDPYIFRIDRELDVYLTQFFIGDIPSEIQDATSQEILKRINDILFKNISNTIRINTLEDLHPGNTLDASFLEIFKQLTQRPYELPLQYDLIFTAQAELKRRNYHNAIIEAETAFEVYLAATLVKLDIFLGTLEEDAYEKLQYTNKYHRLKDRLKGLDDLTKQYRLKNKLVEASDFVNSSAHNNWDKDLYKLRNRIAHAGFRSVSFDEARAGIKAAKTAIGFLENRIPELSNSIQIATAVDHLENTAGRLRF